MGILLESLILLESNDKINKDDMKFNIGWKTSIEIKLFNKKYNIVVKAKAFTKDESITKEQEASFLDFNNNKEKKLKIIETLLIKYSGKFAKTRFTPKMLLFEKDGKYALLLDDHQNEDDGIVVCLKPEGKILSQDEYL